MKKSMPLVMIALLASIAGADTITVDGVVHEDVYIREGGNMYYVHFPATGTVTAVSKNAVEPSGLQLSNDAAHRETLLAKWRAARSAENGESPKPMLSHQANPAPNVLPRQASRFGANTASPAAGLTTLRLQGNASAERPAMGRGAGVGVSDGYVSYIKLNDIALGDALRAMLRGMNLDYEVRGNLVYITSPERLRKETFEALETRVYELNNAYPDTLPKIVVRSGPVTAHQQYGGYGGGVSGYGSGGAYQSGAGYGGGFQQGGGGYGMPMGMGMGQGMPMGGGFGGVGIAGGAPDVTAITNISDLFSNIDDRLVGEAPARIGGYGR